LITQRQTKQLLKKEEKGVALNNQSSQMTELSRQKGEKAKIVNELKSQEKDLLKQLNAKRKRDKDMKNALNAILKRIEKENGIAKKKEEDKNKGNITSKPITPVLTGKPTTSEVKSKKVKSSIELNSGDIKLSGEFQQNKGRLPWPVDNGYVSIHFGPYEVEGLKHVMGYNSGITIITDKPGEQVKAAFNGEVVAIHDLGDSKAVFLKHGKYLTTYGKLSSVSVTMGERVTTGQMVGRTGSADNSVGGQIDFMLLIENREQNPELWLKRR
jgi:septal ring factor EnvC (AmiA/AmiB activator)